MAKGVDITFKVESNIKPMCSRKGCTRTDTEPVTLGLEDSEGNTSEETELHLCPPDLAWLRHRIITTGMPPADELGSTNP